MQRDGGIVPIIIVLNIPDSDKNNNHKLNKKGKKEFRIKIILFSILFRFISRFSTPFYWDAGIIYRVGISGP